jgi:hypothetical protein
MFRDERMPSHPVHRTQSLLVGGAKAARPQVVYTQSYTWSSNRKRKQAVRPQVVNTVIHVVLKPEKETERLDSFLKATESSAEKKTKLYAPRYSVLHSRSHGPQRTGKGNRET